MEALFPEPKVKIIGLPLPDRFNFSDYIPAVGPITVEIRMEKKPGRIVLAPEGLELKWEWDGRTARVEVPRVEIHGVIVVVP